MGLEEEFEEKFKGADRLIILGVGNIIRGDDGVGSKIISSLKGRLDERVKLIDAGPVPESFTDVVKAFQPTHILIIDAADLGREPGWIEFVEEDRILNTSFSTHQMPLSLLVEYFKSETQSKIYLLGIQPLNNSLGEGLTPEVNAAKRRIVKLILKYFKKLS
ncbi:MAG: hydrogenase maturation peptidase HycI [Candidatus Odinarchaeum yellowstonii]|uniref:Hydrogenase maturation peptidase HycI n=1 Tax=Odinarchaeota yellowstonii (strain LCB_4) TaxID=1841599 RepID=A0AAF0IC41_ODILC|nr:MAG: hydrogenase maturation peptidase HycI [Candidatus Odinarchaeum yellowstonii]